jgi:hypothetical protein
MATIMPTSSTVLVGFVCLFGFAVLGFYLWNHRILSRPQASALCICLTALVFGWLWRRDVISLRALKDLIPIPDIADATTFPSHKELEALVRVMQTSPVGPRFGSREDLEEVARTLHEHENPIGIWIIVSPLSPSAVSGFYQFPENRPGWEVVANTAECCVLLRRPPYDLLVAYSPDREGKGTQVVYSLSFNDRKN